MQGDLAQRSTVYKPKGVYESTLAIKRIGKIYSCVRLQERPGEGPVKYSTQLSAEKVDQCLGMLKQATDIKKREISLRKRGEEIDMHIRLGKRLEDITDATYIKYETERDTPRGRLRYCHEMAIKEQKRIIYKREKDSYIIISGDMRLRTTRRLGRHRKRWEANIKQLELPGLMRSDTDITEKEKTHQEKERTYKGITFTQIRLDMETILRIFYQETQA